MADEVTIKKKKIWCETTTRLPLQATTHILNSMRCIFFFLLLLTEDSFSQSGEKL